MHNYNLSKIQAKLEDDDIPQSFVDWVVSQCGINEISKKVLPTKIFGFIDNEEEQKQ